METAIIVGVLWISLLVLCLWVNYRFHQSYAADSDLGFIITNPIATESDDKWNEELKLSKGY